MAVSLLRASDTGCSCAVHAGALDNGEVVTHLQVERQCEQSRCCSCGCGLWQQCCVHQYGTQVLKQGALSVLPPCVPLGFEFPEVLCGKGWWGRHGAFPNSVIIRFCAHHVPVLAVFHRRKRVHCLQMPYCLGAVLAAAIAQQVLACWARRNQLASGIVLQSCLAAVQAAKLLWHTALHSAPPQSLVRCACVLGVPGCSTNAIV